MNTLNNEEGVLHGMTFFLLDLPAINKKKLVQAIHDHGGLLSAMPSKTVSLTLLGFLKQS